MKIAVLCPKTEFNSQQYETLSSLGKIVYTESREEYRLDKLKKLTKGAEIIAVDPDNLGGFEKAKLHLTELMQSLPDLKGVALASTSYSWIDLDYCKKRKIQVTNVPHYSTESVAEHVLGLMICLAKKIIISDRRMQKGVYKPEMGFELKEKTLGVIGLGSIGARVAELGMVIGMNVVGYNRSPKKKQKVKMLSLSRVLKNSDVISINVSCNEQTRKMISKKELQKVKKGVIIVNLAMRKIVDEKAMAEALKSGKVSAYAYEGEDLSPGPLAEIENAIGLKGFAWYTRESLSRVKEIWTRSIISLAEDEPINLVY